MLKNVEKYFPVEFLGNFLHRGFNPSVARNAAGTILSIISDFAIVLAMGLATKLYPSIFQHYFTQSSSAVGTLAAVASGLYPAWKVSRLESIEALRYK